MKKLLLIIAIMFAGIGSAMAQTEKGKMAAGLSLLYGTETQYLGIGAKYRYAISDEFRAEASLNYQFKHDHETLTDGNINFHYLLPVNDGKLNTYPILGVGFGSKHKCHTKVEGAYNGPSKNDGVVGFNAGWGAEFEITEKAAVTLEAQYQFFNKNATQLLIGFGIVHTF